MMRTDTDTGKRHLRAFGIAAAVMGSLFIILSLLMAAGISRADRRLSFSFDELPPRLFLAAGIAALLAGGAAFLIARKRGSGQN